MEHILLGVLFLIVGFAGFVAGGQVAFHRQKKQPFPRVGEGEHMRVIARGQWTNYNREGDTRPHGLFVDLLDNEGWAYTSTFVPFDEFGLATGIVEADLVHGARVVIRGEKIDWWMSAKSLQPYSSG